MSAALGTFDVTGHAAEADAFRAATGLPRGGDILPLTFPMRWLAGRRVREAIAALAPEAGLVPVHEAQSFTYLVPLRVDTPYRLRLTGRRAGPPDQVIVEGSVDTLDGTSAASLEMVLRLFAEPAT